MELYAGTRSRGDKQDLDRMVWALTSVGRVVSPEPEDFYTAGQVVATYTRRHLAQEAEGIRLMATVLVSTGECQRSLGEGMCLP